MAGVAELGRRKSFDSGNADEITNQLETMNYKPQTYLRIVQYIAPAVWERYLTMGHAKRMSDAQKAECDKFLRIIARDKGEVHFVISGRKYPNCKIKQAGCKPSMGMLYTVMVKPKGK